MAQMSDVEHDDAWPCPYCRARNDLHAVSCSNCGSHLRELDDDLFTTVAAENAQVVPPEGQQRRESLWSTSANEIDDEVDEVHEAELVEEEPDFTAPDSTFSFRPHDRPDDVIDEPFDVDTDPGPVRRPSANLFSRNEASGDAAPADTGVVDGDGVRLGRSPFGVPNADRDAPAERSSAGPPQQGTWPDDDLWSQAGNGTGPARPDPSTPFAADPASYAPGNPGGFAPAAGGYVPGPAAFGAPRPADAGYDGPPYSVPAWDRAPGPTHRHDQAPNGHDPVVPDTHGLSAAIGRLRREDQERAASPISVCGALLQHDEVVMGAVVGQMLGHVATVVVTTRRVLVVNGRRWQPIVDTFDITPDLIVRGRHDRDVAALTFADSERLSTVDGIADVGLAIEIADRLRTDA